MKKIFILCLMVTSMTCSVNSLAIPFVQKGQTPILGTGTGKDFCHQKAPGAKTCIPVINQGAQTLDVTVEVLKETYLLTPKGTPASWLILISTKERVASSAFTIKNKVTGKVIFAGAAGNYVGLACTEARCLPWNA